MRMNVKTCSQLALDSQNPTTRPSCSFEGSVGKSWGMWETVGCPNSFKPLTSPPGWGISWDSFCRASLGLLGNKVRIEPLALSCVLGRSHRAVGKGSEGCMSIRSVQESHHPECLGSRTRAAVPRSPGPCQVLFTSSSQPVPPGLPLTRPPPGPVTAAAPRVSEGSPGAAVGLPMSRKLLPVHRSGLSLLQVGRCCWVTGSPAGAGQAEPGAQMAERSSSWLETRPQTDGMEQGPLVGCLGTGQGHPACHPALTQEPGDPPPGPGWPRGRDGSLHVPGRRPLSAEPPLKRWGMCWGLWTSLGSSVCLSASDLGSG